MSKKAPAFLPETYVTLRPVDVYIRLALFKLKASNPPLVDMCLPSEYVKALVWSVQAAYQTIRSYVVENYLGQSRLLLYVVPPMEATERSQMPTKFDGGSPVSSPSNPYSNAAGVDAADILPSLDIEGVERDALMNLDAYGSSPVTNDSAMERPANPPTTAP